MKRNKNFSEENDSLKHESKISDSLLDPDSVLKAPLRFNIMFLLYNYEKLGFLVLQRILKTTPGNLDHHLKKLLKTEWIKEKIHFSPRPLKIFEITKKGLHAFKKEIKKMKEILDNIK